MMPTHPTPEPSALALTSPDALVAALPYLVGFQPHDSVVVLWLRDRRLLLTQRLDLPEGPAQEDAWVESMWSHVAAVQADEIVVALVTPRHDAARLVDRVLSRAGEAGLPVRDALIVDAGRWRSHLCLDPACCEPEGRPVDPAVAAGVAAEFAGAGVAPRPDRESLVREADPDTESAARLAPLVRLAAAPPGRGRESWRDSVIEAVRAAVQEEPTWTRGQPPDDALLASLVAGLDDIRVRDTVLWDLARVDAERLLRAQVLLSAALRCAPDGLVAPVATACAVVAWLVGDGARAQIALERALVDRPDYSLALLVQYSVGVGLPPSSWREAMAALTRAQCRRGGAPRRRRPAA